MPEYSDELIRLNNEAVQTLIPAIAYIALLMLIGLIGNPLVIYFYGWRQRTTSSFMFIVALAVFDLITCLVSLPMEMVDFIRFYTFENTTVCKVLRLLTHCASTGSAWTLVVIAIDRYRKICKPFGKQITEKIARVMIFFAFVAALFSSWPAAVFYQVVEVNITEYGNVSAYDCTTIREDGYKIYITMYNSYMMFMFMLTVVAVVVMYTLVGRQLCKKNARATYMQGDNANLVNTKKYTIVMLCISVAYIVSFLPYLGLATWRTLNPGYEPNTFSDMEQVAFQIGIRSYFLSSICNPIIYGLFNSDFQKFVSSLLCCCKRNEKDESNTT